jgi:hypothetical protein
MKNYVGFVNDHSGSMSSLARAAVQDYNATIGAVREAATREMLDTVVSVVGIGLGDGGYGVQRQVVISNPHVLKPLTNWPCPGGTPLYDGVGNMIELFESLPDYGNPDVSFLVVTTTDGKEMHSKRYSAAMLADKIRVLQSSGRWTFAFRVPEGQASAIHDKLGVPLDNIQEWGTTAQGMAASTAATTKAVDTYFAARTTGLRGSNVFYADAQKVTAQAVQATLTDVSKEVSVWGVLPSEDGEEIQPWAEKRLQGAPFLKGAAFYQLTKTEARVQDGKLIVIRDKALGKVYSGDAARQLLNMPVRSPKGYVRLHPDATPQFDIFIQSTSINRKLVGGTQVLYWPAKGTGFSAADFPWLANGQTKPGDTLTQRAVSLVGAAAVAAVQPQKKTAVAATSPTFPTRNGARDYARKHGGIPRDTGAKGSANRWYIEKT